MSLFQHTIIKKQIASHAEKIRDAYKLYAKYFRNLEIQANIRNSKEEQFQEGFLRELFVKILGYTLNPDPDYNLITEKKNETNSKKADGAITINGEVKGVIELKDHKTTDLKQVETQAFGYKNNNRNTSYVIISNFEKLRFYIDNAIDFIEFNLFTLTADEFADLWICLACENIAKDLPKQLRDESSNNEDLITKQLYKDYSAFKRDLFVDMSSHNPDIDKLTLFKKTQKLLDRFLFVFFAEDKGLLPPNSMNRIIDQWDKRNDDPLNEYQPLYDRLKLYFKYMNEGHKGKNEDIFGYNGGLFKPDELLDTLLIDDAVLKANILKMAVYDFDTEVDVNILGHIFENSLSEIEEITKEITTGQVITSKRKKDGVFYTPRYITTYIVENTLGKLCTDKKTELAIVESEYFTDKKRPKSATKILADKLETYREWLLSLTICDPACGSGAFLNAALDFLMNEHRLIDEMTAKLFRSAIVFPNIENAILENNLYGVDINEESVEIARLALWLRTAKPQRKLNSLNDNIKCGNSLISDPEVAGDKAFDWQKEFPNVFEKGGFDVVIGNPPYFNIQTLGIGSKEAQWIQQNYPEIWQDKSDILFYFIYKAMKISKSEIGYIVSNAFLFSDKAQKLRNAILKDGRLAKIINFEKYMVFEDASITSGIFIFNKSHSIIKAIVAIEKDYSVNEIIELINDETNAFEVDLKPDEVFALVDSFVATLNKKIDGNHKPLQDICVMGKGMETATDAIFLFDEIPNQFPREFIKKRVTGENTERFLITSNNKYILYFEDIDTFDNLPKSIQEHLENNRIELANRATVKNEGRIWWRYSRPMHKEYYHLPKLYCSRRAFNNTFCYDSGFEYLGFSNMTVIFETNHDYSIKYILTLLNSKLLNFRYKSIGKQTGGGSFEYFPNGVGKLPISFLSKEQQQPFIALADQMLSLNADLQTKRQRFLKRLSDNFNSVKITGTLERFDESEFKQFVAELKKQKIILSLKQQDEWEEYFNEYKSECRNFVGQIAATDKEIDRMVYALYGLTEEEIRIVEQ
jgi:type I restriction-modification system DNA methylase subunit